MTDGLPWSQAWASAARDFWSLHVPTGHFDTSVGPEFADRIAQIVLETHVRLGYPEDFAVVDIGCGDGQLLALLREICVSLGPRTRWIGVDLRDVRVTGIESVIADAPADLPGTPVRGVVMAHEWLDEVACDVVERDDANVDRMVLVDDDGCEELGPAIVDDAACAALGVDAAAVRAWVERWWPLGEPGDRAEVGIARDRAWAWMGGLLEAGTALATDYGHDRASRIQWPHGTLTAYRGGHVVRPTPDGTVGLTAHVAWDSCVSALPGTSWSHQRQEIPPREFGASPSGAQVAAYFRALRLRDPARLGSVGWLRWEC